MNRFTVPEALRHPTPKESRTLLSEKWGQVAEKFRTSQQLFGRHQEGCGATIGAMPKCNFACKGCYLSANANHIPEFNLQEIKRQLDLLRTFLGPKGNLQLTDGEVTLRDTDEVIEMIRYAKVIGLTPMLMTHGDTFRRKEGLLLRLVREGGLREMSIHIDTTQRGRLGYRKVECEADLHPLREEFAEIIRSIKQETGIALRTASTVTVTRDNLSEVGSIFECLLRHSDVYHLVSFLPAAQVGRSQKGFGGGVVMEDIWEQLADTSAGDLSDHLWVQGHPSCNKMVTGISIHDGETPVRFHPVSAVEETFLQRFLDRFGGIDFRDDSPKEAQQRTLGLILHAPTLMLGHGSRWLIRQIESLFPGQKYQAWKRWKRGELRTRPFSIVVHQFMSREEVETPLGQERLEHCTFKVPYGDKLISMCEMNTLGYREHLYQQRLSTSLLQPAPPHATELASSS